MSDGANRGDQAGLDPAVWDPRTKTRWVDLQEALKSLWGGSRHDVEKAELWERQRLGDMHFEELPTQVENRLAPVRSNESSPPLLAEGGDDEVDAQGGREGPHGGNYDPLKAMQAELKIANETIEEFQEQIRNMNDGMLAMRRQYELDSQHRMREAEAQVAEFQRLLDAERAKSAELAKQTELSKQTGNSYDRRPAVPGTVNATSSGRPVQKTSLLTQNPETPAPKRQKTSDPPQTSAQGDREGRPPSLIDQWLQQQQQTTGNPADAETDDRDKKRKGSGHQGLGAITLEEILRRATPEVMAQLRAHVQGNQDPLDDNVLAAGILGNVERVDQVPGVAGLRNRILARLAGGVTAGEALQQAVDSAPSGESGRDKELLQNVRNFIAQRGNATRDKTTTLHKQNLWEALDDTESLAGTDAVIAKMGGLKEQVPITLSAYLHEFSSFIQQRAWRSPKYYAFTAVVGCVRGDAGISLGLFQPRLLQFMRDPTNYVISSDILRTRVGLLIKYASDPWRKIHRWVMSTKDENEIVMPPGLIEECKELLFEMAAVFFVFDEHTKDNSQTLGWLIHVLSVLPARYGQVQKDFGRARDGGLAVKSLLVKHEGKDPLLGYAGFDLPGEETFTTNPLGTMVAPLAVPRAPPPARPPAPPTPYARPPTPYAAPRVSGPTDFPYSGAPYRRAKVTHDMCTNCYAPRANHRGRDCPQRCDRAGCRKPNGDAADHARKACPQPP